MHLWLLRPGASRLNCAPTASAPTCAPVRADVEVRCDFPTFAALGMGRTDAREAIRSGSLEIAGDRRLLEQLLRRFRLPARTA